MSLSNPKIVQQFTREQTSGALIAYGVDTSLFLDPGSRTLVMFDGEGKQVRVMALPRQQDAQFLGNTSTYGTPMADRNDRLV